MNTIDLDIGKSDKIMSDFLTDYAKYSIPLSNNSISDETLINIITNVKGKVDRYGEMVLSEVRKLLKLYFKLRKKLSYPYDYTFGGPEGYLDDGKKER